VLSLPIQYVSLLYHTLALTYATYATMLVTMAFLRGQNYRYVYIFVLLFSIASALTHYRTTVILLSFFLGILFIRSVFERRFVTIDIILLGFTVAILVVVQYFQDSFLRTLGGMLRYEYLEPETLIRKLIIERGLDEVFVKYSTYLDSLLSTYLVILISNGISMILSYLILTFMFVVMLILLLQLTKIKYVCFLSADVSFLRLLITLITGVGSIYVAGFFYFLIYGHPLVELGYFLMWYPLLAFLISYSNKYMHINSGVIKILKILSLLIIIFIFIISVLEPYRLFTPVFSIWVGTYKDAYLAAGKFIADTSSKINIYADFSLSFLLTKVFYDSGGYERDLVATPLLQSAYDLYEDYYKFLNKLGEVRALLALKEENFVHGIWGDVGKFFTPPLNKSILNRSNVVYNNYFVYVIVPS